jgi:nucleoside 2-deoxyribosyltransferase
MRSKIYISGKMTDNPYYKEDFKRAELWLEKAGYCPINPCNLKECLPNLTREQYMAIDFKLIDLADGIFMVKNWQSSKGACAELSYAKSLNKKRIYEGYLGDTKKEELKAYVIMNGYDTISQLLEDLKAWGIIDEKSSEEDLYEDLDNILKALREGVR